MEKIVFKNRQQVDQLRHIDRGSRAAILRLTDEYVVKIFNKSCDPKDNYLEADLLTQLIEDKLSNRLIPAIDYFVPDMNQIELLSTIRTANNTFITPLSLAYIGDQLYGYTERYSDYKKFSKITEDCSIDEIIEELTVAYADIDEISQKYYLTIRDLWLTNVLFGPKFASKIVDMDAYYLGSDLSTVMKTNYRVANCTFIRCIYGIIQKSINVFFSGSPVLINFMFDDIWNAIKLEHFSNTINICDRLDSLPDKQADKLRELFQLLEKGLNGKIHPIYFIKELKRIIQERLRTEINTLFDIRSGMKQYILK